MRTNPLFTGAQNIYILQIDPTIAGPGGVAYLTYLGGNGTDSLAGTACGASVIATIVSYAVRQFIGLAVDNGGNIFVAGSTTSSDFPVREWLSEPERSRECVSRVRERDQSDHFHHIGIGVLYGSGGQWDRPCQRDGDGR